MTINVADNKNRKAFEIYFFRFNYTKKTRKMFLFCAMIWLAVSVEGKLVDSMVVDCCLSCLRVQLNHVTIYYNSSK